MPNRLAAEMSPYLRQHANNPVDWRPWGPDALAAAQAEQKPIFLSIGYATCHWCHVMAHESFENPVTAELLNAHFIPVKVDREERPDLDRVYMAFVQRTTGHGGWPMSVWLTPEGKPFFGGTYFPPEDRPGRVGFVTVLQAVVRYWQEKREELLRGADEAVAALSANPSAGELSPASALPDAAGEAFDQGLRYFSRTFDATWGGFGGAPKFPRAAVINFLHQAAARCGGSSAPGSAAVAMAAHTLQKMAEGGVHDQVGGGFHRYSVDERWFVPHFEKMLYDQAQIAVNYLETSQATGRATFAWVARGIFDYVRRDLTGPHGGFFAAEDADSLRPPAAAADGGERPTAGEPHAEGAFYVWTKGELDAALGDDAGFFGTHFGVRPAGNVDSDPQEEFAGRNILGQTQSLARTAPMFGLELPAAEEKLLAGLEKLRAVRARRPRPQLDDKVVTAWNGLMISALARGTQILGEAVHLTAATRAAEFIQRELHDPATGTLYRSWREGRSAIAGFAEDYAFLIQGLLDLYEAGFDIRWLQWAEKLQARMDALFWDGAYGDAEHRGCGGYFNSRADDPTVIVRLKEDYDGAEPAPNSVAAMNLVRLDWMLGDRQAGGAAARPSYRERAEQTVAAFRAQWSRAPQALPQMLCALELLRAAPRTVVVAGDPQSDSFRALVAALHEKAGPHRALLCADGGEGQKWLTAQRPYLAEMKPLAGRATAYVCENYTCQRPVTSVDELRPLLG